MSANNILCVAVHGGAGVHCPSSSQEVKKALRCACSRSLEALRQGGSALGAVEDAVSMLEDEPSLNAATSFQGSVPISHWMGASSATPRSWTAPQAILGVLVLCPVRDTPLPHPSNLFVTIRKGVKNPIRLARAILDHARVPDPLGRLAPMTLVSAGAHMFATGAGLRIVPPEGLVAPRAISEWRTWKWRLEGAPDDAPAPGMEGVGLNDLQDTVGAVAVDVGGGMAAGVSSGGLLLKCPGRIGEAAVFGAGCWAAKGLACSVSGAGEHITRTMLARAVGDALCTSAGEEDPHEVLRRVLVDVFWRACRERGESECNAGVLLLTKEDDGEGGCVPRLWCAFTTDSMAIAYASSKHPMPKALVLRRPKDSRPVDGEDPPIFITALPL